jgi:hypothetical protein
MLSIYPVHTHQHLLAAGPPVAGVDHQVADGPGFVLIEEILDMADAAVGGGDVIARHHMAAAQVHVIGRHLGVAGRALGHGLDGSGQRQGQQGQRVESPQLAAGPVGRVVVVTEVVAFMLARHRTMGVDARAGRDLAPGQRDVQRLAAAHGLAHRIGRDQHLAAGQPGAGVDHQVADRPGLVVEIGLQDMADLAVGGGDVRSGQLADAVQHGGSAISQSGQHAAPPCRWL